MDLEEYRKHGKAMVDYIADYLGSIRKRRVFPDVKPGYLQALMPDIAPEDGEDFSAIFQDLERVIMPGVTHWQSPQMHAYFPALNSPASLLGDMLADGLGCLAFTWASSPACTELEIVVMDWLGKMIGLPDAFLHSASKGEGGGVIQTTASESTLIGLLAARTQMFQTYREKYENINESDLNTRLVAYTSDQAHSSVEKAGHIGLVKMRYLQTDDNLSLRGETLAEAIKQDREKGLIPFFVCATLGTTGACAFDNLKEIGWICDVENLWLHVDAAYAGSAFICPEFRHWLNGIEHADSIAFNPSKWLMVHFDCTAMWVKKSESLHRTFNVEPLYLKHENMGGHASLYALLQSNWSLSYNAQNGDSLQFNNQDYNRQVFSSRFTVDCSKFGANFNALDSIKHWQISLSKRFRALKLWFVLRNFGVKGLQKHIRHGVKLAKLFEILVQDDDRFEIPAKRHLGLAVFRIKGENELTEALLKKMNSSGKIHCVPSSIKGKYIIRYTVTSPQTTEQDIQNDWSFIQTMCGQILNESPSGRRPLSMAEIRKRNPSFGTSLLLSNSHLTPKVMNASFVAVFEPGDALQEFLNRNCSLREGEKLQDFLSRNEPLRVSCKNSPVFKRRLKGLTRGQKQFSLDSHIDLMMADNFEKAGIEEDRRKKSVTSIDDDLSLVEDNEDSADDGVDAEENDEVHSLRPRCEKCGQKLAA